MRIKIFTIFLLVFLTGLCGNKGFSHIHCNSGSTYETPFAKMTDDRHYVKPGSIVFSADGLFLLFQGNLIPINSVQTDAGGVFIRTMDYPYGTCSNCHRPLTPGGTCTNSSCPFSPYYDPDY
jgi:hypothetical protein